MKITNVVDDKGVHVMDGRCDVMSVIENIAESGTQEDAFYVCDLGDIVRKHRTWTTLMPRVEPHYAVKCNDSMSVLETLAALGLSFDCASKGEIGKVMSLGVKPSRIIFANPAKVASHIRYAATCGVRTMTFDNATELHKVSDLYPDAHLVIRLRCDAVEAQCPLGMKFGCDPEMDAPRLLRLARTLGLRVVGVSFHVGSGCREPEVFRRAIGVARNVFDMALELGYEFDLLDIGGGYPGDSGTSIEPIAQVINAALDEYFPHPTAVRFIAEPGRFYVSSAYTLVCNVHSIRHVTDHHRTNNNRRLSNAQQLEVDAEESIITHRMYYIDDGVYGSFNCILYDHQIIKPKPLRQKPGAPRYPSSVWGPTCDALDRVLDDVLLPELQVGDWLVFENMGAYTLPVASPFNGFPIPRVHVVVDEDIWLMLNDMAGRLENHIDFAALTNDRSNAFQQDGALVKMADRNEVQSDLLERLPITIECGGESHVLDLVDLIQQI